MILKNMTKPVSLDISELKDRLACMAISSDDFLTLDDLWEVLFWEPSTEMWEWITKRKLDIDIRDNSIMFLRAGQAFYEYIYPETGD